MLKVTKNLTNLLNSHKKVKDYWEITGGLVPIFESEVCNHLLKWKIGVELLRLKFMRLKRESHFSLTRFDYNYKVDIE